MKTILLTATLLISAATIAQEGCNPLLPNGAMRLTMSQSPSKHKTQWRHRAKQAI
jgi:hypothetical protein